MNLQKQIDHTSKKGILEIQFGEFIEQIEITKPISIRSTNIPITIVGASPTVRIKSKDVILENIHIVANDESKKCLLIEKGSTPKFNNVFLNGEVEGLEGEDGNWDIPKKLELFIIPNERTINKIIIFCPHAARIYPSEIDVIECYPRELTKGINEIDIILKEIPKGSLLSGDIIIETSKYKLKRRISVNGNTLNFNNNSDLNDEYIWRCGLAKSHINTAILNSLPEGTQSEPYEFVVDVQKLCCENYEISIENLPANLSLDSSDSSPIIKGIPKEYGEFKVIFVFKKNNEEYKYSSKLLVNEKVILPLKVSISPNPMILKEDETLSMKINILSSNSSNITYQIQKDLPQNLTLNELTGEIFGTIQEHGKYNSIIKINDGINEIDETIQFIVFPSVPLVLNLEKTYQCFPGNDIEILLPLIDTDKLKPKFKLVGEFSNKFSITYKKNYYFIIGKSDEIKSYKLEIEVEDIYNRKATEQVLIECIEKPNYTIVWKTDAHIDFNDKKGGKFEQQIIAEISEDPNLKLEFTPLNKLPNNIQLTKSGLLSIEVDGKTHNLTIKAVYNSFVSERDFIISTNIESSKIIDIEGPIISKIFKDETAQKKSQKPIFKKELQHGRINQVYKDFIFDDSTKIINNNIEINGLPSGLFFNQKDFSIEGRPQEIGTFYLKLKIDGKLNDVEIKLTIKKLSLFDKVDNKDSFSTENNGSPFNRNNKNSIDKSSDKLEDNIINNLRLKMKKKLISGKQGKYYKDRYILTNEFLDRVYDVTCLNLPDGLSINNKELFIEGTPTVSGPFSLIFSYNNIIIKEINLFIADSMPETGNILGRAFKV